MDLVHQTAKDQTQVFDQRKSDKILLQRKRQ